ncbi:hypothetical protein Tco_0143721 [Tanacetum coccineum]|uniref:Uncharacterized protein n=1 Tax=Tanacetum coccineum TaxID=301880 RepID=A0ABQ5GX57_9ASTR
MNTSQDIKMQMVDDNVGNQVRQNVVQNDGNEVGQNAVINRFMGMEMIVQLPAESQGKHDADFLQQQLQALLKRIEQGPKHQVECEFMAAAKLTYEETERVKGTAL